jgi:phosphoribosylformylglycinamidine synthase PurS subunit
VTDNRIYVAKVYVTLKAAVNDPQGVTVTQGLKTLGFDSVISVRMGKYLEIHIEAANRHIAETAVTGMCERLLTNPVIEEYRYEIQENIS